MGSRVHRQPTSRWICHSRLACSTATTVFKAPKMPASSAHKAHTSIPGPRWVYYPVIAHTYGRRSLSDEEHTSLRREAGDRYTNPGKATRMSGSETNRNVDVRRYVLGANITPIAIRSNQGVEVQPSSTRLGNHPGIPLVGQRLSRRTHHVVQGMYVPLRRITAFKVQLTRKVHLRAAPPPAD